MSMLIYIFITIQLIFVSWYDLKYQLISNKWHLVNALACGILYYLFPEMYHLKFQVLLFPAGLILGGFFLFLLGIMGAGDSKYLASLFLIIPLEYHLPFFEMLVLGTLCVGGILLSWKVLRNGRLLRAYVWSRHWQAVQDLVKSHFSYAPVILLAWVFIGLREWL
jgi:prepilin peptidase CpaA